LPQPPSDLPHHAEKYFRVFRVEAESQYHAADFVLARRFRSGLNVSTLIEGLEQNLADLFIHTGSGALGRGLSDLRSILSRQLIQADSHSLAEIHREVIFLGGNRQQPVAVAEVIIRQTDLFGTEQKRDASGLEVPANVYGSFIEPTQRMLQRALASRSRTDNERAVGNGLGQSFVFLGTLEKFGRADCRARLAECNCIGIDQPQLMHAEVAHCPCCGADVQRIARAHKDDDEIVEFGGDRQTLILRFEVCVMGYQEVLPFWEGLLFGIHPLPPRSIGINDLAHFSDLIYGLQQLRGKILSRKELTRDSIVFACQWHQYDGWEFSVKVAVNIAACGKTLGITDVERQRSKDSIHFIRSEIAGEFFLMPGIQKRDQKQRAAENNQGDVAGLRIESPNVNQKDFRDAG
jgi:hypothetical protein